MMNHFQSQQQIDNFISRARALQSQIGYEWMRARDEGAINENMLHQSFKYIKAVLPLVCMVVYGATDNLLTDAEVDTAYEQIKLIGNLCNTAYLLNDTL